MNAIQTVLPSGERPGADPARDHFRILLRPKAFEEFAWGGGSVRAVAHEDQPRPGLRQRAQPLTERSGKIVHANAREHDHVRWFFECAPKVTERRLVEERPGFPGAAGVGCERKRNARCLELEPPLEVFKIGRCGLGADKEDLDWPTLYWNGPHDRRGSGLGKKRLRMGLIGAGQQAQCETRGP